MERRIQTDPFMYGYQEICDKSVEIINLLNSNDIPCTALTKDILPKSLDTTSKINSYCQVAFFCPFCNIINI